MLMTKIIIRNSYNLPSALQLTSGHRIDYLYSSEGVK
jgi:hypothetical protein